MSSARRPALAVPTQLLAALTLLRYAYPVYWDGAGPMPSFFYFGKLPSTAEYYANQWQYDARFVLPYVLASVLLVAVTFLLARKVARRINNGRTTVFLVTFGLLFAVAALSDFVVRTARLNAGAFLSLAPDSVAAFLLVTVPLALLSAFFADKTTNPSPHPSQSSRIGG